MATATKNIEAAPVAPVAPAPVEAAPVAPVEVSADQLIEAALEDLRVNGRSRSVAEILADSDSVERIANVKLRGAIITTLKSWEFHGFSAVSIWRNHGDKGGPVASDATPTWAKVKTCLIEQSVGRIAGYPLDTVARMFDAWKSNAHLMVPVWQDRFNDPAVVASAPGMFKSRDSARQCVSYAVAAGKKGGIDATGRVMVTGNRSKHAGSTVKEAAEAAKSKRLDDLIGVHLDENDPDHEIVPGVTTGMVLDWSKDQARLMANIASIMASVILADD